MADPQLELAYADRHAGQQANLAAGTTGHRDHRTVVEIAVALCARSSAPFTADNVHRIVAQELGTDTPYDRNLVSSVMGIWSKDGRIIRDLTAGLTPSINQKRKGSRNGWWRGNQHQAPLPRAAS